ncbi:hypothetical protein Z046_27110 [Pseudomonas aeruginosa VRFPA09]|nr:hypothetical protein Z046_27110 [Pseudomonas aeruginosa VRFPA09]
MGDGAGKAEQLGAGRRQVDRVVVAGGTGIAPADVGGRLPVVDRLQRQRLLLGFRRNFAGHLDAAAEHLAVADPEQAKLVFQAGDDAEGGALVVRLQVFHRDAHGERAEAAERAQHVDAVLQVDQAEQREGEALVGEQRHLQREGEDVRVGRRQQAVVAEAADLAVALEVLRVHRDLAAQPRRSAARRNRPGRAGGAGRSSQAVGIGHLLEIGGCQLSRAPAAGIGRLADAAGRAVNRLRDASASRFSTTPAASRSEGFSVMRDGLFLWPLLERGWQSCLRWARPMDN